MRASAHLSSMRNFSYLEVLYRGRGLPLYLVAILVGALVGVFFLQPVNEFVYYHKHSTSVEPARTFVLNQMRGSLTGAQPIKTLFYAGVGSVLGITTGTIYAVLHRRLLRIQPLQDQLDKDVHALIAQGEGPDLEFKSSFRWDIHQQRANEGLETGVLKTLAAFMNGRGGTLLVGVADDGKVLGLGGCRI